MFEMHRQTRAREHSSADVNQEFLEDKRMTQIKERAGVPQEV